MNANLLDIQVFADKRCFADAANTDRYTATTSAPDDVAQGAYLDVSVHPSQGMRMVTKLHDDFTVLELGDPMRRVQVFVSDAATARRLRDALQDILAHLTWVEKKRAQSEELTALQAQLDAELF